MDSIISSFGRGFEQLREHHSRFRFLYLFSSTTTEYVRKSDIDGFMFTEEVESALNDPV